MKRHQTFKREKKMPSFRGMFTMIMIVGFVIMLIQIEIQDHVLSNVQDKLIECEKLHVPQAKDLK